MSSMRSMAPIPTVSPPPEPRYHAGMRLEPRDYHILELLQRHKMLSSRYLYPFTEHMAKDRYGFSKRLLALRQAGYIYRPEAFIKPHIDADYHVFELTPKGRETLGDKRDRYAHPISGWDEHAFMASTITANLELEARKAGYQYISQEEILSRAPRETQTAKSPLRIPSTVFKDFPRGRAVCEKGTDADQLFGIEYGAGARFFVLEADRGHEPLTRKNFDDFLNQTSIERKMLGYANIYEKQAWQRHFGIKFIQPMFVTTALDRMENMMELAKKVAAKHAHLFLFTWIEGFHPYKKSPPLIPELFGAFQTTRGTFDISKP